MTQKVIHPSFRLKGLCLNHGKKSQRGGVDIFVYEYEHAEGILYIYKNQTNDKMLQETVEF